VRRPTGIFEGYAFRNNVTLNQMRFSADSGVCSRNVVIFVSAANITDVYGRYLRLAETLEALSILNNNIYIIFQMPKSNTSREACTRQKSDIDVYYDIMNLDNDIN